jgi:hypothetical protein
MGNNMPQEAIFMPMGALVLLTFIALLLIPFRRLSAAFAGKVTAADFRFGESERVPGAVSIPNRNYMNLLEMPILFYVVCILLYVSHRVDQRFLTLAWVYVGLRVLHSLVHLTYNKVTHRLTLFALSNVVVATMWASFMAPLIPWH